jgi:hypothetical protein
MATWVIDMFHNFNLAKKTNIAKKNSADAKVSEKISTCLKNIQFQKNFDVVFTKFKNN